MDKYKSKVMKKEERMKKRFRMFRHICNVLELYKKIDVDIYQKKYINYKCFVRATEISKKELSREDKMEYLEWIGAFIIDFFNKMKSQEENIKWKYDKDSSSYDTYSNMIPVVKNWLPYIFFEEIKYDHKAICRISDEAAKLALEKPFLLLGPSEISIIFKDNFLSQLNPQFYRTYIKHVDPSTNNYLPPNFDLPDFFDHLPNEFDIF